MKNTDIFNVDENGTLVGVRDTFVIPEGVRSIGSEHNSDAHVVSSLDTVSSVMLPSTLADVKTDKGSILSRVCSAQTYAVHPENTAFTSEDGVLYTRDKKRLLKFPPKKKLETFFITSEIISECAMLGARDVSQVVIASGCRKIEKEAFIGTTFKSGDGGIRKYYIPPSVREIDGEIFDSECWEEEVYYAYIIIGGAVGSYICEYAKARDIDFVSVNEDEIEEFINTPLEVIEGRLGEEEWG